MVISSILITLKTYLSYPNTICNIYLLHILQNIHNVINKKKYRSNGNIRVLRKFIKFLLSIFQLEIEEHGESEVTITYHFETATPCNNVIRASESI